MTRLFGLLKVCMKAAKSGQATLSFSRRFSSSCNSLLRGLLLIAFSVVLEGCAEVQPWERGNLAKPHMGLQPFPSQAALREHIYGSRESASGSTASSGGGGCGCY